MTITHPVRLLAAVTAIAWIPLGQPVAAQPVTFETRAEVRVSPVSMRGSVVEPHAAASPWDPSRIVVGAMHSPANDLTDVECVVFTSHDAGMRWSSHGVRSTMCADPWIHWADPQTVLLAVLDQSRIAVYRSFDAGLSWQPEPEIVPGAHDHPLFAGRPGGPVYLISGQGARTADGEPRNTLYVGKSGNGVEPFTTVTRFVASNLSYEAQTSYVDARGRIHVPFLDHHRLDGRRRLDTKRSWIVAIEEGAARQAAPRLISERCNSRSAPVAWPSLAVGPPRDSLPEWMVWICTADENRGFLLHTSNDLGEVWTDPVHLLERAPDGAPSWTKVPTLAFDANGTLALTWIDRGADPNRRCQRLRFSVVRENGSMAEPIDVSELATCPRDPGSDPVVRRFPGGGDYNGLAVLGPGRFLAVWSESRDGIFQIRAREVRVSTGRE